jgi:hypothetical protein
MKQDQHRIVNHLTALQLAVDGIKRDDHLPPTEEALVDKALVAVEELTEALLQHPSDDVTRP